MLYAIINRNFSIKMIGSEIASDNEEGDNDAEYNSNDYNLLKEKEIKISTNDHNKKHKFNSCNLTSCITTVNKFIILF